MFVVAGLGNPGSEYKETKHNIGFLLVDALSQRFCGQWKLNSKFNALVSKIKIGNTIVILAKPQTYMNKSGVSLQPLCKYYKLLNNNLIVICDDVSFELGKTKISTTPGSAGHNGIKSIMQHLGGGFIRYRIGIGTKPFSAMNLSVHVLSRFTDKEKVVLENSLHKFFHDIELLIDKSQNQVMNIINKK